MTWCSWKHRENYSLSPPMLPQTKSDLCIRCPICTKLQWHLPRWMSNTILVDPFPTWKLAPLDESNEHKHPHWNSPKGVRAPLLVAIDLGGLQKNLQNEWRASIKFSIQNGRVLFTDKLRLHITCSREVYFAQNSDSLSYFHMNLACILGSWSPKSIIL